MFKVVIFSSGSLGVIGRLVRRIHHEVPEAQVCGVLLERRPGKPLRKRISTFAANLRRPEYVKFASQRLLNAGFEKLAAMGTSVLHIAHGGRPEQVSPAEPDCPLMITRDCHDGASLEFVRSLDADLGLVYGTRILKPCLFSIPHFGSINIHKRKVPDYRGGGPVGLWEMLDGQREIGVTVHEVEEKLDAGAVIHSQTIAIEPFDNLTSLALKAHVVANDLLVRSVADYAQGSLRRTPQQGSSRMFKNPTPQQLTTYEKELRSKRPPFKSMRGRSTGKLLVRSAVALPALTVRNWRHRLRSRFPVSILFHHLVSDRSHALGMSTEHFLKHVEFLRKHYDVVTMKRATEMLESNSVRKPTVALTVDDGYGDNSLTLRAIRERFDDVPMTLFVSSGLIGSRERFPHDVRHGNDGFEPLTWEQLTQLQREGFEIGSHTRTHFDCGSTDIAKLQDEIAGSRAELEQHLGTPVELFSFPFGLPKNISPEAMKIANQSFKYVFSAFGGSNLAPESGEVKHLKRWAHPNDLWELELMIQGILDFEPVHDKLTVGTLLTPSALDKSPAG